MVLLNFGLYSNISSLVPRLLPTFRHGEEPGYEAKYLNDEEVVLPVHTLYIGGNSSNKT